MLFEGVYVVLYMTKTDEVNGEHHNQTEQKFPPKRDAMGHLLVHFVQHRYIRAVEDVFK